MKTTLSLLRIGHATSLFLAITYLLCVAFDLLFPQHAMYRAWSILLPGFEWLSWGSFFLGLVESYGYGWYIALIWTALYNFFSTPSSDQSDAVSNDYPLPINRR
ncbi:MAG: DUF5676 family membrane protein [Candidatus Competibacteraceae bacterium]|jgi:hypothetical protein|nr:DUF5676 family membrane protein [Candidatus Competibacteraceae bacterium]